MERSFTPNGDIQVTIDGVLITFPKITSADYRAKLEQAKKKGVNPKTWFYEWRSVYVGAQSYKLPDIIEPFATKDFLLAVGARMAPKWASFKLNQWNDKVLLGEPRISLDLMGKLFIETVIFDPEFCGGSAQQFATREGPAWADGSQPKRDNRKDKKPTRPAKSQSTGSGYSCPCKNTLSETHRWAPEGCGILQFAVEGYSDRQIRKLSDEVCEKIRTRYQYKRWRSVRAKVEADGWSVAKPSARRNGRKKGESETETPDQIEWSGTLIGSFIYPPLLVGNDNERKEGS